ncbi:MAG: fibronectin type III domain-containing protein [Armatimonadetes bacterium]|nr:fibronectin type III domain-containing protein [Armatimonadota bacterium]
MTGNNFSSRKDAILANDTNVMNNYFKPVGVQTKYGLSPAQASALNTTATAFAADLTNVLTTHDAYTAAVKQKDADRKDLLNAVKAIQALVFSKPGLTAADIAAAGFVPHDTSPTSVVPVMPTNFVANPLANGTVNCSWKRAGNKPAVTFVVEASTDGSNWSVVSLGNKTKVTLTGYTPGNTVNFRVVAARGELRSPASNVSTIYGEGSSSTLQIAA